MNTRRRSQTVLEVALAAKLRELLGDVVWLRKGQVTHIARGPDGGGDLLATLPLPKGGKAALYVECKAELRPSLFPLVAGKTPPPSGKHRVAVRVLALPFVSPRMADLCKESGWSWFDLAGNCLIDVPGVLRLERIGNAPVHRPPKVGANLGTPEAGRVIRALLAPENAGRRWTQRDVRVLGLPPESIQSPVSLGLVNKVARRLREEAFIEERPDGGFQVRDPLKLLFAWRDAYRFDRHEQRAYFTLLQGKRLHDALARLDPQTGGFSAYAAFSAAEFQAPHVRQAKVWVYVSAQEIFRLEETLEAKTVESGANLVVLVPNDDGVFYLCDAGTVGRMAATNAVQTYVDLYHCGSRGEEAAEAVLAQRLKPEWKQKGLPA
jgi:hypothetical protein